MSLRLVFLLILIFQGIHAVEEYAFKFYETFPLAAILNEVTGGLARPLFIAFNLVLIVFGVFTYWRLVSGHVRFTRVLLGIWAGIELYNGLAHFVWGILAGGYIPGLVSAPLLFVGGVYLAYRLYLSSPSWKPGPDA